MPHYALLFRQKQSSGAGSSPDEMQEFIARYRRWVEGLKASGAFIASEKLVRRGRTLHGGGGRLRVSDGPFVEGTELVAGFYVIAARDEDHATELARACPALENGSIEIRELVR